MPALAAGTCWPKLLYLAPMKMVGGRWKADTTNTSASTPSWSQQQLLGGRQAPLSPMMPTHKSHSAWVGRAVQATPAPSTLPSSASLGAHPCSCYSSASGHVQLITR